MPIVAFPFRVVDSEAEKVFTTYSNYLAHVRNCLEGTYGIADDLHEGLAVATRTRRPYRKIQRRRLTADEENRVGKSLRLALATEAQLRLRGQHDIELLPDLLQGAASEAYYAVYHAARAFFTAGGFSVQALHASVLNQLSTVVAQRDLLPPPWSVTVCGGPRREDFQTDGLPASAPPPGVVHNLAHVDPTTVWDSLTKALCTTRERQLKERRDDWCERNNRKRLPPAEAQRFAKSLQPTTVFNFLWRLRKRSDYRDADVFLDGVWTPQQAKDYHRSIETLVAGSITVLDTLTVAYAGPDIYQRAIQPFLGTTRLPVYGVARIRKAAVAP